MKYVLLFVWMFCTGFISGQKNIVLEFNHMLKERVFEFNASSQNNLEHPFTIRRMDYYLSRFQIVHDGGKIIDVPELIVLVSLNDNQEKTQIDLGNFPVENIEKINFYLGLDSTTNHSDPALYPVGHPLGPRFPTMHWGWASGYRFIAVEGKGGPANNQEMQLHALGNQYHRLISREVRTESENNTLKIKLNADYSQLFHDIPIKQGVIVHGSDKEIVYLADNFVKRLFSSPSTSGLSNEAIENTLLVYPNPTTGRLFFQSLSATFTGPVMATVTDSNGAIIFQNWIENDGVLDITKSGIYYLHVKNNQGRTLPAKKIVVP